MLNREFFLDLVEYALIFIMVNSICFIWKILNSNAEYIDRATRCSVEGSLDPKSLPIWDTLPIHFHVDNSVPLEARKALESAGDRWERALGKKAFVFAYGKNQNFRWDGKSVILWSKDGSPLNQNEQAKTTTYFGFHRLSEADIRINAKDFRYSYQSPVERSSIDLESLMVHEFGHALGLDHQSGGVMNPFLENAHERRYLDASSAKHISCLYRHQSRLTMLTDPQIFRALVHSIYQTSTGR